MDHITSKKESKQDSKVEKIGTILLEVGFFNRSEILEIENCFKEAGVYLYLKILERLTAEGGRVRSGYLDLLVKNSSLKDRGQEYINCLLDLELIYKDKSFFGSERVDRDLDQVKNNRKEWRNRQAKYRESLSAVTRESLRDSEGVTQNMNMNMNMNMNKNKNKNKNLEQEVSSTDLDRTKPVKYGEFVFLPPDYHDQLLATHGKEFLKRCIEKLDNWISQDPTPSKIRAGENAASSFKNWVLAAIAQEKATAEKINNSSFSGNGHVPRALLIQQHNLEVVRKVIEEEKLKNEKR